MIFTDYAPRSRSHVLSRDAARAQGTARSLAARENKAADGRAGGRACASASARAFRSLGINRVLRGCCSRLAARHRSSRSRYYVRERYV